jgi:hypothetical protein
VSSNLNLKIIQGGKEIKEKMGTQIAQIEEKGDADCAD